MSNVTSAKFSPVVSRAAVDETIHDALRQFVGRGKPYSVKELQRDSGVPARMIESAVAPVGSTDFRPLAREYFWSIAQALGAPFLNQVANTLANVGVFNLPNAELPQAGAVVAESAEDHAAIAMAASDGKFSAKDHPRLWLVGQEFIQRGMQLVGLGKPHGKAKAA